MRFSRPFQSPSRSNANACIQRRGSLTRNVLILFASILMSMIISGFWLYSQAQASAKIFQTPVDAPEVSSDTWINSNPLSWKDLKGKVVLIEFWTFECYNCENVQPYVKQWYKEYKNKGFEILAIHSPEFSHERNVDNVKHYVSENEIHYPVIIDNDFSNWRRYNNRYWPAMYLVDKQGKLRYLKIGEGQYDQTEKWIRTLLES